MFVIGRIIHAGRQQNGGGIVARVARGDGAQRRQKRVGVVVDRRHAMGAEQLRAKPHHRLAVLQHVGDARRRARVVLQNVEIAIVDAHDVDAGDVDVNAVRRRHARHFRPITGIAVDQIRRHDAGADDLPRAVNVAQKPVERVDALHQPLLQMGPFGAREDARQEIEGDQTLGRLLVAIDREGDAHAPEQHLGLAAAGGEQFGRSGREPVAEPAVDRPGRLGRAHFVE